MSNTENLTYQQRHMARTNLWFLVAYWLHVPVFAGIAFYQGSGLGPILGLSLAVVAGPTALYFINRHSHLTACSMGLGGIALSAVLIHLGGGMIEMHFHIFVLLPLLAFFGSPWVVLCGAGMAAVHHVALYFFLPTSLFNYAASLWIVALHALFVVLATGPGLLLARLIRAYVIGTGEALAGLGSAGSDLTRSSQELSSASTSLATDANAQAAAVQEITATLAEIEARTGQVSRSLGQTRDGQLAQLQLVLGQIESAGSRLTTTLSGIRESSESITKIARGIEEIAFQTNILALNAAVEAARAGEAGAGFAVVAGEVRALAARAADSARETTTLIESAAQRGRAGEAVSAEVARHLDQVLGSFRELDAVIRKAATDVEEQSRGVTQISSAMQQIDSNAQTSSARSEELSATAVALREQSETVSRSIQSLARVTGSAVAEVEPEEIPAITQPGPAPRAIRATPLRGTPSPDLAHFR